MIHRMGAGSLLGRLAEPLEWLKRGAKEAAPRNVLISGARVLRLDGPVLIFEFEVPETGFLLPADGTQVDVRFENGSHCSAEVLGGESSTPGPHRQGLTVRLGIKLSGRTLWDGREVLLHWTGHVEFPDAEVGEPEIDVHIILGARP